MLKIKVEKIIEYDLDDGRKIQVSAGTYEHTLSKSDAYEIETLKQIIAIVNHIKI